jgi:hypothetical protein
MISLAMPSRPFVVSIVQEQTLPTYDRFPLSDPMEDVLT